MEPESQGQGASASSERVIADIQDQRKLVCVEVPGIVDDDKHALSCLGGINTISKAHFEGKQNIEMRFRPEDCYSKPAVARKSKVSNLVLKVKRRKRRKEVGAETVEGGVESEYQYSAELLGVVNSSYQFPGMADYQVLPPGLNAMNYHGVTIDPKDFQLSEPLDDGFVERDLPTFVPPISFTKFDKPFNYLSPRAAAATKTEQTTSKEGQGQPSIGRTKPKRVHNIYGLLCSEKRTNAEVPTKPHPQAYGLPHIGHPKLQELKELFEERPVWTRTALQFRVNLRQEFLRCLLSVVSYKFLSAPFKNLWVKFGYDPRTDPASKIHQGIEYRIPKDVRIESDSRNTRRISEGLKKPSNFSDEFSGPHDESEEEEEEESLALSPSLSKDLTSLTKQFGHEIEETSFVFYPDKLPTQRQVIYQLCDIKDEGIQDLIHSNDGQETEFKEPNGWCEEHTYEKIRKALTATIRQCAGKLSASGGKQEKKNVENKMKHTKGSQSSDMIMDTS